MKVALLRLMFSNILIVIYYLFIVSLLFWNILIVIIFIILDI